MSQSFLACISRAAIAYVVSSRSHSAGVPRPRKKVEREKTATNTAPGITWRLIAVKARCEANVPSAASLIVSNKARILFSKSCGRGAIDPRLFFKKPRRCHGSGICLRAQRTDFRRQSRNPKIRGMGHPPDSVHFLHKGTVFFSGHSSTYQDRRRQVSKL